MGARAPQPQQAELPQPLRTATGVSGARPAAPGQGAPCPQQTSSLLLCLVMDYSKGSFQKVIEKKREAKEVIDWEVRQTVRGSRPGATWTL